MNAAIFVDYENLHILATRLRARQYADEYISEILDRLKSYVQDEHGAAVLLIRTYADYNELRGNGSFIQRSLYYQGCEPVYVSSLIQPNAVELRLAVDVTDIANRRPDLDLIVILTGDRLYLPLAKHLVGSGRNVLVVTHQTAEGVEDHLLAPRVVYLDAAVLTDGVAVQTRQVSGVNGNGRAAPQNDAEYLTVTDPLLIQTMEAIEEHFGQYEEVYLTPLLRKLSEELEGPELDPKSLVGELEDAGAVRLEKRKGFPYDYTVLIVNSAHPDVARIQEAFRSEDMVAAATFGGGYDEDPDDFEDEFDDEYRDSEWAEEARN
jgi:uncharacterized LabA/DUF88 family protein